MGFRIRNVEELRSMGVRRWRAKPVDRWEWTVAIREARDLIWAEKPASMYVSKGITRMLYKD